MIIAETSPFRRIRADLAPQQASFLDGIRISAEMLDIAYLRLTDALWKITKDHQLTVSVAPLFLDAWAIVDSTHRLRELLDQMPSFKKNVPKYKIFRKNTQKAADFRNIVQHLRNELKTMAEQAWPVLGHLTWLAVLAEESRMISTCIITPGRVQSGRIRFANPAGIQITRLIDHITLCCKTEQLSLTMLYEETEKIIKALEPCLTQIIADQTTLPADFFGELKCELKSDSPG